MNFTVQQELGKQPIIKRGSTWLPSGFVQKSELVEKGLWDVMPEDVKRSYKES